MKDKFNREIDYLRISVTENCNLRCIYCIEDENYTPQNSKYITNEEIERIAKQCATLGIKKVRITGGEPLARKDIEDLFFRINNIQGIQEIYITTNGVILADKIEKLKEYGLTGINISLDSLKEDRFYKITKFDKLQDVLQAIDKALEFDLKVKINTVLIDDINKDEIIDFVNITKDKNIDLRFIELMPIGAGKKYKGISNEEVIEIIKSNFKEVEEVKRIKRSGPAKYIKVKGYKGKIGFISAMSDCFCEECNRIRLTSDGFLKKCLHYNYGVDLKKLLRENIDNENLKEIIKETIYDKPEKHLFKISCENKENKYMNQIGG